MFVLLFFSGCIPSHVAILAESLGLNLEFCFQSKFSSQRAEGKCYVKKYDEQNSFKTQIDTTEQKKVKAPSGYFMAPFYYCWTQVFYADGLVMCKVFQILKEFD